MMAATPRHVIFGTGAIGLATLDALRRRGESVRLVKRSGTGPVPHHVEVLERERSDPPSSAPAPAAPADPPDAPAKVWPPPNDPHPQTTRQLVDTIYQLAGQPK